MYIYMYIYLHIIEYKYNTHSTIICNVYLNYRIYIYIWSHVPCSYPPNGMGPQVAPPSL